MGRYTYILNIQIHYMDLARGTYSSVHVLIGACLVPSDQKVSQRPRVGFQRIQ